jgi:hypothetical protein
MRRRARKASSLREAQVRELGVLVVEMERLGRRNEELLARKARKIAALDRELDGLSRSLGGRRTLAQVVAAGIAGGCPGCGSLLGTDDRFCSHCGRPAGAADSPAAPAPDGSAAAPAADQLQLETTGAERR